MTTFKNGFKGEVLTMTDNQPTINQPTANQPITNRSVWRKLKRHSKRIGKEAVETTLKLYYSARDDQTPAWARTVIYGALIYFLVPVDAIPDFIPGGYTDDLTTLLAAIATVSMHIKPLHKAKAKQQTQRWFSDEEETQENT
ncbi:YkvA family protein [Litoribrevibacter albus]|uniref:YkvA family protein n=1 Tax=Litoribrevibacter albus TaxID=1473156 RepID=UPI0024E13B94|nr:YkvA family protein [Litoribrevibacter albus]